MYIVYLIEGYFDLFTHTGSPRGGGDPRPLPESFSGPLLTPSPSRGKSLRTWGSKCGSPHGDPHQMRIFDILVVLTPW